MKHTDAGNTDAGIETTSTFPFRQRPNLWRFLGATLTATCVLTAAACSGNSSSSDGATEITLSYWQKPENPALKKVVSSFEDKHKNIRVHLQQTPTDQYADKLKTQMSAGSGPDVIRLSPNDFPEYVTGKQLEPLADTVKEKDIDTSLFYPAAFNSGKYDGTLYGLPATSSTIGLFYNKKLFRNAHVDYPDSSWDWDDFKRAAHKLTNKTDGVWGTAAELDEQQNYYNTVYQAGGRILSKDHKHSELATPEAITGLKFWTSLIKDGSSPSYAELKDTDGASLFQSGRVAMIWGGSWDVDTFAHNKKLKGGVGVAPVPAGPAGRKITLVSTLWTINANSDHPDAAKQFLAYLNTQSSLNTYAKAIGDVSIPNKTAALKAAKEYPDTDGVKNLINAADHGVRWPTTTSTAKWQEAMDGELAKAWKNEVSVSEAAKKAADEVDKILKNES